MMARTGRDKGNKAYALMELLESSSDDDSDFDEETLRLLEASLEQKEERPKVQDFVQNVVYNYSESEFRRHFRIHRCTCEKLVEDFEKSNFYPSERSHGGSEPISAETHILSFLWFAGNKTCIRAVSSRFGVGESTFHKMMHRVLNFLVYIAPNIIKFPSTEEEKEKLADEFKKQRKNDKTLRKAGHDIDRDKAQLEREEKKLVGKGENIAANMTVQEDMLSEDEDEKEAVMQQVLDEIGIEISGQMAAAPSAHGGRLGESSRVKTDEEIEAQLAKLRS